MDASLISVSSLQKTLAILAILALVFGPFSKVFTAEAIALPSCTVVSDTTTQEDGHDSFNVSTLPDAWTSIADANWIWGDADNNAPAGTQTFTKDFVVNGTSTSASLSVSADNGLIVTVNGTTVDNTLSSIETNYNSAHTYDITSYLNANATNTLSVDVINFDNGSNNPAGLIYKLSMTGNTCAPILPASLTIVKDFSGEAPSEWSFDFNGSEGIDDFSLTNAANSETFEALDADSYTVTENYDSEAWQTPSISCSDSTTGVDGKVTVDLAQGENVTCTFTNTQTPVDNGDGDGDAEPAICEAGVELIQNGSFESPVITQNGGAYESSPQTDWSVKKISDSSDASLEFQNTSLLGWGAASEGSQSAELAGNEADVISQTIPTVNGANYTLSWDFSARPDTSADQSKIQVSVDEDSTTTEAVNNTFGWTTHTYSFIGNGSDMDVSFADIGATSDGLGALLDKVSLVCNPQVPPTTYHVFGNVWNDLNSSDERDEGEDALAGKTVHITNGETTFSTTTDSDGDYYFDVPAGTWTITENAGEQWDITYPNDGSYTVTVPTIVAEAQHQSIFVSILDAIVPTAYAAILPPGFGPFNFGNVFVGGSSTTQSGGGNGKRIELTDDNSDGQVLGASTSTDPVVVTPVVIPVGAPNTGAGGTSALVVSLPTLNAVMFERRKLRSIKNG